MLLAASGHSLCVVCVFVCVVCVLSVCMHHANDDERLLMCLHLKAAHSIVLSLHRHVSSPN